MNFILPIFFFITLLSITSISSEAIEDCDFLNDTENCFALAYSEFQQKVDSYNSEINIIETQKAQMKAEMDDEMGKLQVDAEKLQEEANNFDSIMNQKFDELNNLPSVDDYKKEFEQDIATLDKF